MSVSGVKTVPCISAAHWWPPNTSGTLRLPGRHGPTWTGRVALRLCSPERRDPWMRAAWAGSLPKSQAAAEAKLSIALGLAFFFPLLFFSRCQRGCHHHHLSLHCLLSASLSLFSPGVASGRLHRVTRCERYQGGEEGKRQNGRSKGPAVVRLSGAPPPPNHLPPPRRPQLSGPPQSPAHHP